MIWSNVAKIGSTTGNPTGPLLSQQAELAKLTLLEEVREYRPSLVVFVPGNYAQKIIEDAFGFTKKGWKDSPDGNVSWLRYSPEFPKVRFLWVRHPQGKTTQEVWYWTAKAKELLSE